MLSEIWPVDREVLTEDNKVHKSSVTFLVTVYRSFTYLPATF